jgi:hypothetical protein
MGPLELPSFREDVGEAISSPSPRSYGERVGVRGIYKRDEKRKRPLTRRQRADLFPSERGEVKDQAAF